MSPTLSAPARPADPTVISDESATFASLGVPKNLTAILAQRGITNPFPIQRQTLPDSLAGVDIIGRGRTGSGKTLAFVLPMVVRLSADRRGSAPRQPRGLILVPTRELAVQVAETLEPVAKALGLSHVVIHGGVSAVPQIKALNRGVDVVIACPGRLEDLMQQRHCRLDQVAITVVDEADHMADLGFLPVVKRVLDKTPKIGQRLLFSATLDNGVDVLVNRYLHSPVMHSVDSAESPVPDMEHHVLCVDRDHKPALVEALASGQERTLLFTRTKHTAKKIAAQLSKSGIPSVDLHGNLSQNVRTKNLEAFASGEVLVMVATDIAARGIHVDDIRLVVHVDPPAEHKAFLHRSGRTARAGASGTVVTVMTPDQKSDVDSLTRKAGIKPRHTKVKPGDAIIVDLTGPVSPKRMRPVTQPQQQSSRPRTQSGRRPGPGNGQRTGSGNGQRSGSGNGQRAGARGGRRPGADNGPRGPRSSSGQRQQSRHR
ncbi:MAG: DEAD/DEAH box helicase [Actinomycetota bacterium]